MYYQLAQFLSQRSSDQTVIYIYIYIPGVASILEGCKSTGDIVVSEVRMLKGGVVSICKEGQSDMSKLSRNNGQDDFTRDTNPVNYSCDCCEDVNTIVSTCVIIL